MIRRRHLQGPIPQLDNTKGMAMRTPRVSRHLPIRVAVAGSLLAAVTLVSVPAASASTLGGTATIVDGTTAGGGTSSTPGASTDLFTLTFPPGAACTGSSNGSPAYFEYSYLFPQGAVSEANLASSLTFNGAGDPNQSWAFGLLTSNGQLFEAGDTAPATSGPGQLANIPTNFEWAELVSGANAPYTLTGAGGLLYNENTSGVWEAGIACAYNNGSGTHVISDFWNTEVTFTAVSTSVDPNGFTWSAVAGLGTWVPEARWAVTLPVAGLAVLAGGWWVSRRRRSDREAQLDAAGVVDD
ncbi:MAG TPA: hypothetical protein VK386_10785 [Acidimicrobiales bacterium]|nr:hypothetical protein [Acidimicrobiales bacterium]